MPCPVADRRSVRDDFNLILHPLCLGGRVADYPSHRPHGRRGRPRAEGRSRVLPADRLPLSPTSGAVDVVRGLLAVYPFHTLYVADLDAIQGNGDNFPALRRIRAEFPTLEMWIDNGAADLAALEALIDADLAIPVIGSESQRDSKLIAQHRGSRRIVLSLDFRGDAFLGPGEILAEPALWPRGVIVMTLARVGSDAARISRGSLRSERSLVVAKSTPRAASATWPIFQRSRGWAPLAS